MGQPRIIGSSENLFLCISWEVPGCKINEEYFAIRARVVKHDIEMPRGVTATHAKSSSDHPKTLAKKFCSAAFPRISSAGWPTSSASSASEIGSAPLSKGSHSPQCSWHQVVIAH